VGLKSIHVGLKSIHVGLKSIHTDFETIDFLDQDAMTFRYALNVRVKTLRHDIEVSLGLGGLRVKMFHYFVHFIFGHLDATP